MAEYTARTSLIYMRILTHHDFILFTLVDGVCFIVQTIYVYCVRTYVGNNTL